MGIGRKSLSRRKFLYSSLGVIFAGPIFTPPFIHPIASKKLDVAYKKNTGERRGFGYLDKYGGLASIQYNASGFFRINKEDRWWFVTPAGSAFLSFGLNHPNSEYLLQSYNINFWRKEFGFEDPSEDSFRDGFVRKVMKDLAMFEMNTIGTHARKDEFGILTVPYIQGLYFVNTSYWLNPKVQAFIDVYSPDFEKHCERVAERLVLPKKNDPFLMGYTLTDCPILTDFDAAAHGNDPWGGPSDEAPTWPRVLRNNGPESPGKQEFVSLMRKRYPEIEDFNKIYRTQFSSFDFLLKAKGWSSYNNIPGIDDCIDNHVFLLSILGRYYSVAYNTIRKYDTNHLIFGDIINGQTPPKDEIISLMAGYSDLIAYQFYGGYDEQNHLLDKWSEMTGKPLFHADSSFCVPYKEMPNPVGAICSDQGTRANRFLDFAAKAFPRPDFIGWNWCGWMDSWEIWKKARQHTGLQDPFGNYHHPMPEALSWFGSRLYDFGRNKNVKRFPDY